MGFKCRKCYVVAGSEEFPTGDTDALRRSRAEVLIKKCAQCLLDCDVGWALDTSRCPTMNDFINIKNLNTSYSDAPGLLFINSISGCKLLMFYEPNNMGTKNYNNSSSFMYAQNTYHSGLCCSMIPGNSSSVFGDPTTETFYPDDATRVCGTYYATGVRSDNAPAAHKPVSSTYYYYYIFASEDCLTICSNHHTAELGRPFVPIYSTGKIFGKLLHSEDVTPQAKYGTIIFRYEIGSSQYEGWAGVIGFSQNALVSGGSGYNVIGKTTTSSGQTIICFTNAQGDWLNLTNSGTQGRTYTASSWLNLGPNANSGSIGWSAMLVVQGATDLDTYGVVPGNGFKGFLDTNYFRAIGNATAHQTLDNHSFFVPETNLGLAIGWDPSNDESLT